MGKPHQTVGLPMKDDHRLESIGLEVFDDVAENIADNGAKEQQDGDDHDGHEYEDQRVLNQTLAFLPR